MGIRFRCHHCEHELHVKDFQGGKRGRCPKCQGRFRVPLESAEYSLAPELETAQVGDTPSVVSTAPAQIRTSTAESPGEADSAAEENSKAIPDNLGSEDALTHQESGLNDRRNSTNGHSEGKQAEPTVEPDAANPTLQPGQQTATDAATVSTSETSATAKTSETSGTPSQPATLPSGPLNPILADANAQWYVRPPSGGQYGPAINEHFVQWLREHRVTADSYIWRDGWPDWHLASHALPEHFGGVPNAVPAASATEAHNTPAPASPDPTSDPAGNLATGAPVAHPVTALDQGTVQQLGHNNATASAATVPATGATAGTPAVGGASAVAGSSTAVTQNAAQQPTLSERNRLNRKQRRRRNYIIMMAILSVLTIGLVVALVVILMLQSQNP